MLGARSVLPSRPPCQTSRRVHWRRTVASLLNPASRKPLNDFRDQLRNGLRFCFGCRIGCQRNSREDARKRFLHTLELDLCLGFGTEEACVQHPTGDPAGYCEWSGMTATFQRNARLVFVLLITDNLSVLRAMLPDSAATVERAPCHVRMCPWAAQLEVDRPVYSAA